VLFFDSIRPGQEFLLAMLYTVVIMNIAANPKPLFRFENRVTGFLGNISYGLYVYHFFVIRAILRIFKDVGYTADSQPLVFNVVLYALTLILSILIAGLSYRFFETPFLRLKSRFTIVRSGNNAAEPGAPQPDAPPVTDPAT
jgi:peptidoglycan/LPS O-acetylase OafA/YrhL